MELIKEKVLTGETILSDCFNASADTDLIVPDIKPDILKILRADSAAYITSKDLSDGRLTVNGKVYFTIIYMPDTAEQTPQSIRASAEFSHRIENPKINGNCGVFVNSDIIKTDFHIINSRKISLKAAVSICCDIMCGRHIEFASDAQSENIQVCTDVLELNTLLGMYENEFLIKDSIEIPPGKASVNEILQIDCRLCGTETKALTEKLVVKGSVHLSILYTDECGISDCTDTELPFTEVFDFPDLCEEDKCDLNLRLCDFDFETECDNDGDRRIINLELLVCGEMRSERKESFTVITDCFCPGCKTKLTYTETEVALSAACAVTQNSIRESAALPAGLPPIRTVYNVTGQTAVTKSEVSNGKIAVSGKTECYIQYISDNTQTPICGFKKDIPFEYLLDCPEAQIGMDCCIDSKAVHTSYCLNVAGEVEIRYTLLLFAKAAGKKSLRLISDAATEEIPCDSRKGMVIYFVQPKDTIWKIAREYCVSVEDIVQFNTLTDNDILSVGQRIVIPPKR